jgi:uncharacterized membrane protein YccC
MSTAATGGMRLSDHPRATSGIRRAKGYAGLGTFALVIFFSMGAGLNASGAIARALGLGVVAYMLAWAAAVTIWRQIVLGELEAARARRESRLAQARERDTDA